MFGWLIFGLIAGFVTSNIVNAHGEGVLLEIVLGIVAAMIDGFISNSLGEPGVTGLNIWSFVVATVIILLVLHHAFAGRRAV